MNTSSIGKLDPVRAPEPVYRQRRYLPRPVVDWVYECDRIMMAHGSVESSDAYEHRYTARNRAKRLIRHMVEDLRLHERWELVEHTHHAGEMFTWSVQYVGRRNDGHKPRTETADR